MFKFFTTEAIQIVLEALQKECIDGKTCTRARLLESMGLEKDAELIVDAIIKRELTDSIEVKYGPSGGYSIKGSISATAEVEITDDFVQQLQIKIDDKLKRREKAKVADLVFEMSVRDRFTIEKALAKMPQFTLRRGVGVVRVNG